ncbi:response regulator [Myxococcus sp. MISCRS1]|jgi:two-component system response regulator MprA|uniref:response regulator n=1 Tax=Myxococcus TaxID=32 RepID=UPI001CC14B9D|nr:MULTISPECIES: response regulator [unclassified Myxococcus]MBZ4394452.1 response regulator [Myxococcus sp. AS-1-15]MBZ4410546.1 response regulator [Myxococcus sp. XM-1-1-1]MCY1001420.1 response regulator [Myxococcus sp. MISCRS1]BDT37010.1 response regulator [Myxococcus sp. MH1]
MLNCVLAVDDDPDILMAFKDVLELEGHRVLLARGGREALELLGRGERPDVILLDLMMPDGNGWEFRDRQLADASLASIPVVVISGQGVSAREVIALGVDDYLRKPVDVERLLGAVSRFAASAEGDSPHA